MYCIMGYFQLGKFSQNIGFLPRREILLVKSSQPVIYLSFCSRLIFSAFASSIAELSSKNGIGMRVSEFITLRYVLNLNY